MDTETAWALAPGSDPVTFEAVDPVAASRGGPVYFRPPTPPLSFRELLSPREVAPRFPDPIVTWPREFASPALRWRGFVWTTREDERRLLTALQAAESAILFFAWLGRAR